MTDDADSERKRLRVERLAAAWKRWWAEDYSWRGLEKHEIGGAGGLHDEQTLEDYWRRDPQTGEVRDDDAMWDAGELEEFAGRLWHVAHLPITSDDGEDFSWKADKRDGRWPRLEELIAARVKAGRWTPVKFDTIAQRVSRARDGRAQIRGAILRTPLAKLDSQWIAKEQMHVAAAHAVFLDDVYAEAAQFGPGADFRACIFYGDVDLSNAKFYDDVDFANATFVSDVDLEHAKFFDRADFSAAAFVADASLEHAVVSGDADFTGAAFWSAANLRYSTFSSAAYFLDAVFWEDASFRDATFLGDAAFENAEFFEAAHFMKATFSHDAKFSGATFKGDVYFRNAVAVLSVQFEGATFSQRADFEFVTVAGVADFKEVAFVGDANFQNAAFLDLAQFPGATFHGLVGCRAALFDGDVTFEKATFSNDADFSEATFLHDIDFTDAAFVQHAIFERVHFDGDAEFKGAVEPLSSSDTAQSVSVTTVRDGAQHDTIGVLTTPGAVSPLAGRAFSRANFARATFAGDAAFSNRRFLERSSFARARFCGVAMFHDSVLDQSTDFYEAQFKDVLNPNLECPLPPGVHDELFMAHQRVWRARRASGESREVWTSRRTAMREARNAGRRERTIGALAARNERFAKIESAFQTLKLIMEKLRRRSDEHRFHRFELMARAQRRDTGVPPWERGVSWLYAVTSDYGGSAVRPIVVLIGVLWLVGAGLYHGLAAAELGAASMADGRWLIALALLTGPAVAAPYFRRRVFRWSLRDGRPWALVLGAFVVLVVAVDMPRWRRPESAVGDALHAITFSWSNTFRPFHALSVEPPIWGVEADSVFDESLTSTWEQTLLYAHGPAWGLLVRMLATLQSIASIVLIFLSALAIRRRFQII